MLNKVMEGLDRELTRRERMRTQRNTESAAGGPITSATGHEPRLVVVMGEDALEELNVLRVPLARELEWKPGEIQRLTPTCDALTVPDIDGSLDDERAKRDF